MLIFLKAKGSLHGAGQTKGSHTSTQRVLNKEGGTGNISTQG
jgi:hypothetical protein